MSKPNYGHNGRNNKERNSDTPELLPSRRGTAERHKSGGAIGHISNTSDSQSPGIGVGLIKDTSKSECADTLPQTLELVQSKRADKKGIKRDGDLVQTVSGNFKETPKVKKKCEFIDISADADKSLQKKDKYVLNKGETDLALKVKRRQLPDVPSPLKCSSSRTFLSKGAQLLKSEGDIDIYDSKNEEQFVHRTVGWNSTRKSKDSPLTYRTAENKRTESNRNSQNDVHNSKGFKQSLKSKSKYISDQQEYIILKDLTQKADTDISDANVVKDRRTKDIDRPVTDIDKPKIEEQFKSADTLIQDQNYIGSSDSILLKDTIDVKTSCLKTKQHSNSPLTSTQKQLHFLSPDTVPSMLVNSKSLQRLQNQSSTETSGLGETITSGFSSQESIASHFSGTTRIGDITHTAYQDQGIDLQEDTRSNKGEVNGTFETVTIDFSNTINDRHERPDNGAYIKSINSSVDKSIHTVDDRLDSRDTNKKKYVIDNEIRGQPMKEALNHQGHFLGPADQLNNNHSVKTQVSQQNASSSKPRSLELEEYNAGPNFDELFIQSETLPVPQAGAMGLQIEQINSEWNKNKRGSSIKSRSSQGSFRSRAGSTRRSKRFLTNAESQWMQWGRERRASFRRRMNKLEKPDPEVPARASTPVKKARQEGLMFVHPDLESKYISEEDIHYINRHRQQRLQTYKVIDKSKKVRYHHDQHDINRLTVTELNVLSGFWEHRIFIRSRYVSILLSLVTMMIYIGSICSSQWITYSLPEPEAMNHFAHEGLWYKCRPVFQLNHIEESCNEPAYRDPSNNDIRSSLWENACFYNVSSIQCLDKLPHWQNAVIGLMIFSAAFGFVAAILAICGVCTSPLPKKIYYFHSAGEIFFICALSTTVALVIYPVAIAMDANVHSHTYGSGYGLGWGGTAFFFAASFCMSLDELVRESSQNKCCRYLCWRSRSDDRGDMQHV